MKQKVVLLFFMLCCILQAQSQTIFARLSGDWDQTTVWSTIGTGGASCGCTPAPGDDVLIDGFDVDIDAGTGDVTANSIQITNTTGTDARLRVQAGATLTVTTDFEIESNSAGNFAELTVVGTGSGLDILGDFLADQNDGEDLLVDIDDNAQVNITGNADFLQDGGDDMELNLNQNSGNAAQWNVNGNMLLDHDGGDDMRILVDDASSLLNVDGDLTVNLNSGLDDDMTFNLDAGDVDVEGDIILNRALTTSFIQLDLDGGDVNCDNLISTSSGVTTLGDIRITIDQASQLNCNFFNATISGGDDLSLRINENAGTAGQMNVDNDFTVAMSGGDDFEMLIDQDDSEFNVTGDVSITMSGGDDLDLFIDNDATWDIGGDFTVNTSGGGGAEIDLAGGADDPTLSVGNDFLWLNETGNVDCAVDVNGGTFSTGGNFTLTNDDGGDDMDIDLDEDGMITVGGNFVAEITGGDDMRLDIGAASVGSTAQFLIDGDASILLTDDSGPNPFWRLHIFDDTRFTVGGSLILTTDFTATGLCLLDVQNTAELSVDGDVDLNAIASGELEVRLNDDSFLRIGGDFLRGVEPNHFGEFDATGGNGTVEYMGSDVQVIAQDDGGGGDSFQYMNLEIDNSFGTIPQLTLEGDVLVRGDLTMNDGVVASDVMDILIVADGGTTSNASDDSYVDGYMRKVGNEAFTFPSGDEGFYGPIGITAPSGATEQFEAEYFNVRPNDDGFDETMLDPSLDHISFVEYWKLNRTSGASTPTVTLSWDTPRSGGVVNESDLRFARWDGSNWDDHGAASIAGTPTSGTLDNSVAISAYSDANPYTIATIDPINPLPIELISFTAQAHDQGVHLKWRTKSEINCDHFILEKSADGVSWTTFAQLQGAGNSSVEKEYTQWDEDPLPGISYYRLKQTDFDGAIEYFGPISVTGGDEIVVYPNPANDLVFISGNVNGESVKLYSMLGQEVEVSFVSNTDRLVLNTENLPNGTYYIRFDNTVKPLIISH